MAFHDVVFPMNISIGAEIGPTRAVEIIGTRAGTERRNLPKADSRRRYNISVPPDDHAAQDALLQFWEGRRGATYAFPILNPVDHKTCAPSATVSDTDQTIGTGDGATTDFQLVKVYEPSGPNAWSRDITRPITATVVVALDGVPQPSGWTVARLTGIISFSVAPGSSVVVTAGCQFHDVVRFDGDQLAASVIVGDGTDDNGDAVVQYTDVGLIEVLGE